MQLLLLMGMSLISNALNAQCTVIGSPSSGQRINEFCAPVTKQVWYRYDFAFKPSETDYQVTYYWNDGSADENITTPVQWESFFPGDTTWYILTEPVHLYPDDGTCDYVTEMVLVDNGFECGDSRQTQDIASWHTDDVAAAQGFIEVAPEEQEVCQGDSLTGFQFADASSFACNVGIAVIRKPNNTPRHVQFVYNTNPTGGQGIPNMTIDVYGTIVQLTDNNGDPVPNSWTVNPLDGSTVPVYSTVSEFFEGPVISTGFDQVGGSQLTFPISFPGSTAQAGDYFEVTVRNWNFCNPWNASQSNPNAGDARTDVGRIVIIDSPAPPTGSSKTICVGGDRELTVTGAPVGEFRWYADALKTTLITTGSSYTQPQTAPGTYNYWVSDAAIAGNNCESQLTQLTLTINPLPDNSLAVSDDGVCEGEAAEITVTNAITGTRYRLRNDAGNALLAGPLDGTGTDLTFSFTPSTSLTANVLAEIIATGCQTELTDLATIDVSMLADITLQPTDEVICEGESGTFTVEDDGNPVVTAHQWQVQEVGAGPWIDVSGPQYSGENSATLTYTMVPAGFDGNRYRCILTTGASCMITSGEAELTVNPLPPDRILAIDNPFMCYNGSTEIEVQNATNGIEYTLRIGTTDQSTQTGDGSNLPFPVGPLTSTTSYNIVARNRVTGCSRTLSGNPVVTINPELSADIPGITDQCVDQSIDLPSVNVSGGSGTFSYIWTGTEDPDDVQNPPSFVTTITGTHSYTANVTDQGFLTLSTMGGDPTTCAVNDNEEFVVHPLPEDRTVTIDHTQICYNTGTTVHIQNSQPGISYQLWNSALTTPFGTQTGDGTTLNFPTGNLTADRSFTVIATSSTTPACTFELSDNPSVTVNNILGVVAGVDDNAICSGTTISLSAIPSGGSGSYSYAWTGPDGFTSGLGNPTDAPLSEGLPHTYSVVLTDIGFTPSGGLPACTTTDNIAVTVNLVPTVNVTPAPGNFCTNETVNLNGNVTPGTGTALTHLWTGSTAPLTNMAIENPGFLTDIPGTYPLNYRVTDENGCFDEGTTTITITGPVADITANGISAETAGTCSNTDLQLDGNPTSNPDNIDNTTHRWSEGPVALTGQLTPMGPGPGAETPLFNSGTVGDYTFYYEVGDLNNCFAYDTIVVTVSQVDASPLPAAPEPCAGVTVNLNGNPSNGSGTYTTHTWTEDPGNPAPGVLSAYNTRTPSFSSVVPGTYRFDYYVQDNGGCDFTYTGYTIVVKPVPDLTDGITGIICSGNAASTTLSIANGPLAVTYSWGAPVYSDGSLSGGSAGSGSTIDDNLVNRFTNTVQTATYSVSPTVDGCAGNPEDVVITVKPEPVITAGQTGTACSGTALDFLIGTDNFASGEGVTFTWPAPVITGGMTGGTARETAPGLADNITDTFINLTGTSQTATYTITPHYDGCTGAAETVVFTIAPQPVITPGQEPVLCSGEIMNHVIAMDNFTNPAASVTFTWPDPVLDPDPDFTGGAARPAPNGGNITDSYSNFSNTTLTATYQVTPALNGCTGATETVFVHVKPEPVITTGQEFTVCSGEELDIEILMENFTNPGDNVTFTWPDPTLSADPNFNGGEERFTANPNNINGTYTNLSGTQQTATYHITPHYNGCSGATETIVVRVNPEPQMTSPAAETLCSDAVPGIGFTSDIPATYNWEVINMGGSIAGTTVGETGTGDIPHTLINTGSGPAPVTYRVVPASGDGCEGASQDVTITVNAPAGVSATNTAITIVSGNSTPAGSTGLEVSLSGAAAEGTPASWIVVEPFPAEGTFDDPFSLNPVFTPSANQVAAGYTVIQYITNDPDGAGPCLPDTATVTITISPMPTADAGNDTIICFNNTIELQGWIGGAATSGTWSVVAGGGSGVMGPATTSGNTVTAIYEFGPDETGVDMLTFRLETDDPDGAGPVPTVYDDKMVTVNPLPSTTPISGEDTVCVSSPNLVYGVSLTPGSFYEWIIPPEVGTVIFGGTGLNSNMAIVNAAATAGSGSIRVFETNQYGCEDDTVYKPVVVTEQSVPDPISGPAEVCAYSENLIFSVPDNAGSTYQWFLPAGAAIISDPGSGSVEISFAQFGGDVRVTETNAGGCVTNHGPKTVTVNALPPASISALPPAVCPGDSITFTAAPTGAASYQFLVNGIPAQFGPWETYTSDTLANGDQVSVIVTTAGGCSAESSPVQVTIYELPAVVLESSDTTICAETPVNFTAISASAVSYNFLLNGISQQSGALNFFAATSVQDGDAMQVEVTTAFGCKGTSDIITMEVLERPAATIAGDYTVCPGGTTELFVTATNGTGPYEITIDNGVGTISGYNSGEAIPVNPVSATTYRLTAITGANGCITTEGPDITGTATVTIKDPVQILTQPVDVEVCEGDDAGFGVGAAGTGRSFTWFRSSTHAGPYTAIPASDTSFLEIPVTTTADDGTWYYVVVSGDCNSDISDTVQLTIASYPVSPRNPYDLAVCEGLPAGFGIDAGPVENPEYQWFMSIDGGSNWNAVTDSEIYSGSTTDSLSISAAGSDLSGTLYYAEINGKCIIQSNTAVATLTVWENPTAGITSDHPSYPQLCGGEQVTLNGNPSGGSGTYTSHLWSGDSFYLNNTTSVTATFESIERGSYDITYTVTDDRGCTGQSFTELEINRPVARFVSDAVPQCGELTVQFTNQSSDDAVSYSWDFDNGQVSAEEHPVQTFDNRDPAGLVAYYNVTMVATDAAGCSDSAQSVVTIYPSVNPTITATPQRGCGPLEVLLTTQPGGAAYNWNYGDGNSENGSYTAFHLYTNPGTTTITYQAVLQTTSAYGCIARDTVEIEVDAIPQPAFTASPEIQTYPGSGTAAVTFENGTAPGPWEYMYDFGDGSPRLSVSGEEDVTHQYTGPGIYNVKLFASNGDCTDSVSRVVTISHPAPVASFNSILEGCHPLDVEFTNNSIYADSYRWQMGDGTVITEEHPLHTFYQPGEYTVTLVANGPGGSHQASVEITVHATPQVLFNYSPDSVFVKDIPVRFFNLTAYADTYYWDFGDMSEYNNARADDNTSTRADPLHVYQYEGWKDVLLVGSNDHCSDSLFIPMAIKVKPAGDIMFPNAFRPGDTPSGGTNTQNLHDEERNTIFFPGISNQVLEYELVIYNRWGEMIFISNDINIGWDGFVDGKKAAQGVYVWRVKGIYSNGAPYSDAGNVTLLW